MDKIQGQDKPVGSCYTNTIDRMEPRVSGGKEEMDACLLIRKESWRLFRIGVEFGQPLV